MALTASSLISSADKRTYGKRGKQPLSKPLLLEELSYQDQLITQLVSQNAPDLLSTVTGVITLTNSGNINGYTLASGIHYRDFTHVDATDDEYKPINMVQRQHRDERPAPPAAMLRSAAAAGVFYPIDPLNKRWADDDERTWFEPDSGHTVSYSYVPLATQLTSLSDTLRSPDMAREVIVSSLVMSILLSSPPTDEVGLETWRTALQAETAARTLALQTFMMQVNKFVHPSGNPGSRSRPVSESEWVAGLVGG